MQALEQQGDCSPATEQPSDGATCIRGSAAVARRSTEDTRLNELNEAAAQARRDRKQIQQKMQELDRPREDSARKGEDVDMCRSVDELGSEAPVSRQEAESRRLQQLQDAAAQARRDRKQIQMKMQDLEHARSTDRDLSDESVERKTEQSSKGQPSREAKKAAEAQHLQALQEAAAESRRERLQLQQKMQGLEQRQSSKDSTCRPGQSASARSSQNDAESRRADREVAEAQHVQALQEAAAEARRERRQLQQKMQDMAREERRDDGHNFKDAGYGPDRGLHSSGQLFDATQAKSIDKVNDTSQSDEDQLRRKVVEADEALMSTIEARLSGYPSPAGELKLQKDVRSSPPKPGSTQRLALGGSGEQCGLPGSRQFGCSNDQRGLLESRRSIPPSMSSPQAMGSSGHAFNHRSRSSEVSAESPKRRPLGRSSSLGLAGSMLARSDSRSRADAAEGATSASNAAASNPELPQSPQFGSRDVVEDCKDEPAFGGTWSKDLRLLRPIAADSMGASAEFGESFQKAELHSSSKQPTSEAQVVLITDASQADMLGTTLRLPDLHETETPAEELLAMKLSRLRSPPPARMTGSKEETSRSSAADSNISLGLSAEQVQALQVPPAAHSEHSPEHPTLGSLSYTGTCTLSSKMSTACIAAK